MQVGVAIKRIRYWVKQVVWTSGKWWELKVRSANKEFSLITY